MHGDFFSLALSDSFYHACADFLGAVGFDLFLYSRKTDMIEEKPMFFHGTPR
jgi:hypothetical protein